MPEPLPSGLRHPANTPPWLAVRSIPCCRRRSKMRFDRAGRKSGDHSAGKRIDIGIEQKKVMSRVLPQHRYRPANKYDRTMSAHRAKAITPQAPGHLDLFRPGTLNRAPPRPDAETEARRANTSSPPQAEEQTPHRLAGAAEGHTNASAARHRQHRLRRLKSARKLRQSQAGDLITVSTPRRGLSARHYNQLYISLYKPPVPIGLLGHRPPGARETRQPTLGCKALHNVVV